MPAMSVLSRFGQRVCVIDDRPLRDRIAAKEERFDKAACGTGAEIHFQHVDIGGTAVAGAFPATQNICAEVDSHMIRTGAGREDVIDFAFLNKDTIFAIH